MIGLVLSMEPDNTVNLLKVGGTTHLTMMCPSNDGTLHSRFNTSRNVLFFLSTHLLGGAAVQVPSCRDACWPGGRC